MRIPLSTANRLHNKTRNHIGSNQALLQKHFRGSYARNRFIIFAGGISPYISPRARMLFKPLTFIAGNIVSCDILLLFNVIPKLGNIYHCVVLRTGETFFSLLIQRISVNNVKLLHAFPGEVIVKRRRTFARTNSGDGLSSDIYGNITIRVILLRQPGKGRDRIRHVPLDAECTLVHVVRVDLSESSVYFLGTPCLSATYCLIVDLHTVLAWLALGDAQSKDWLLRCARLRHRGLLVVL